MYCRFSLRVSAVTLALVCAAIFTGCGSKDIPAKTVLTDTDKIQIQEYQKQATDEWGKPVR